MRGVRNTTVFWTLLLLSTVTSPSRSASTSKLLNSTNDVKIEVKPDAVLEGFTKNMALNCSFEHEQGSDFSTVMSLILSKTGTTEETTYSEVAAIASVSPNSVKVKNSLGGQVSGRILANGISFITYEWIYPGDDVAGNWKCEAYGMDQTGHPRVSSDVIEVLQRRVDLGTVMQKVKEMDSIIEAQKSQLDQASLEINNLKSHQSQSWSATFSDSFHYGGHEYYLSRPMLWSVDVMDGLCRVYGGYLVEIDDQQEYTFIKNFLLNASVPEWIAVGTTDYRNGGRWTFMYSFKQMSYFNWHSGEPGGGSREGCLFMMPDSTREMYDGSCIQKRDDLRFICEIP